MTRRPPRVFSRRTAAEAALLARRFASRGIPLDAADIRHTLAEGAEALWYHRTEGAVILAPYRSRTHPGGPLDGPRGMLALIAMGNIRVDETDALSEEMHFAHRRPESRLLSERESEHALLHYVDALVHERDPADYFARWNTADNGEFVAGQNLFDLLRRVVWAHVQELVGIVAALDAEHGHRTAYVIPPLPLSRRVSAPVGRAAAMLWGDLLERAFFDQNRMVSTERLRITAGSHNLDFPLIVHPLAAGGLAVRALARTADTLVPEEDGEVQVFEHGIIPRDPDPRTLRPDALAGLVWHDDGDVPLFMADPEEDEIISLQQAISLVEQLTPGLPAPRRERTPTPGPTSLHDAVTVLRDGPPSDAPVRHAERSRSTTRSPGEIEIPHDLGGRERKSPGLLQRLAWWRKRRE